MTSSACRNPQSEKDMAVEQEQGHLHLRPVTVLHVISSLAVGGAERNLLNLVLDQTHPSVKHIVACRRLNGGLHEQFVQSGVELVQLKQARYALYNPLRWREPGEIAKLARDKQVDIIHGHCAPSLMFAPIAARKAGCRCVISVHAMRKQLSFFEYRQIFPVARWVDLYLEGSREVRNDLHKAGIPDDKLAWVPYGIDGSVFASNTVEMREQFRKQFEIAPDAVVACRIARFHPDKGFDTLLEMVPFIVQRIPNFKLVLVGDGSQMSQLKQMTSQLGISQHVLFTGFYLHTEQVYAASDLVLITARAEALGISQLEALAAGKAFVAFDIGGLGEVLEHQQNALMVEYGDQSAYVDAVEELVSDQAKRRRFEQESRRRFNQGYSVEAMRDGVTNIYQELCS